MTGRQTVRNLSLLLIGTSVLPVAFGAYDYFYAAENFGKGLSLTFLLADAGAFALTSAPALLLVWSRPVAAMILVLFYPVAWVAILSQV